MTHKRPIRIIPQEPAFGSLAFFALLLVLEAVLAGGFLEGSDGIVMKAMQDELARSMKRLQLENLRKPYFISYRIQDSTSQVVAGSFGALLGSAEDRARSLTVEVRVGDYPLDNTNFNSPSVGQTTPIPIEDGYTEIRRQLWLATDAAYKRALEDYSHKKAALDASRLADDTPDFSREEPTRLNDDRAPVEISLPETEKLIRGLSALFREMPQVNTSMVTLASQNIHTLYVNSEGTALTRTEPVVNFVALASAQAPDGMLLLNYESDCGHSTKDIPTEAELARQVRKMGEEVKQSQAAPLVDLYNGPVLFEAEAAARLFSQAFAGKLLARRRPLAQENRTENSFLDKLGARVLPDFLTVVDDPTRPSQGNLRLLGGYKLDEDGVPARATKIVEGGYLRTLLTTRDPVRGLTRSTGNSRGSGAMPSNLIVTADQGLSPEQIKERLIQSVNKSNKQYGLRVDRAGFFHKVFADGHEELVRNAETPSLTAESFKDIVAATSSLGIFNNVYNTSTGPHIASFVAPSLLFEDLTVRKPTGEVPKLPIATNPFFDK